MGYAYSYIYTYATFDSASLARLRLVQLIGKIHTQDWHYQRFQGNDDRNADKYHTDGIYNENSHMQTNECF